MRELTVRSIATPASTNVTPGYGAAGTSQIRKMAYGVMDLLGSDSGSYQMVASEIGGGDRDRVKLLDNLSDAAMRKAMSEHVGQQANLTSPKFNAFVEFEYKPTFLKQISGLWLLVAGRDPFAEIYSAHTMRRAKVLQT